MSRKASSILARAVRPADGKAFESGRAFEPFVKAVPCCVMARLILDWLIVDALLKELFLQDRAESIRTRVHAHPSGGRHARCGLWHTPLAKAGVPGA